jgi:hypothetical protein
MIKRSSPPALPGLPGGMLSKKKTRLGRNAKPFFSTIYRTAAREKEWTVAISWVSSEGDAACKKQALRYVSR